MQTFEPPSINAAIKGAIENTEIIAPFDGFITTMPNIVGILHLNHKALMTAVKGSILCDAVELEYQMCAILSLDKSGGYNQVFNDEYIRLAKDTFGTKKKRYLKWLRQNAIAGVNIDDIKDSLEEWNKLRNATAHYPISGIQIGDTVTDICLFIYTGTEHIIIDIDNSVTYGTHHVKLLEHFKKVKEHLGHGIKTVAL